MKHDLKKTPVYNLFTFQKLLKRGIILKCQGNPVSCYGKRTQKAKKNIDEPTSFIENEYEMEHAKEVKYEREIENLIESCRYGSDKSCSQILKIMLMNANMNE